MRMLQDRSTSMMTTTDARSRYGSSGRQGRLCLGHLVSIVALVLTTLHPSSSEACWTLEIDVTGPEIFDERAVYHGPDGTLYLDFDLPGNYFIYFDVKNYGLGFLSCMTNLRWQSSKKFTGEWYRSHRAGAGAPGAASEEGTYFAVANGGFGMSHANLNAHFDGEFGEYTFSGSKTSPGASSGGFKVFYEHYSLGNERIEVSYQGIYSGIDRWGVPEGSTLGVGTLQGFAIPPNGPTTTAEAEAGAAAVFLDVADGLWYSPVFVQDSSSLWDATNGAFDGIVGFPEGVSAIDEFDLSVDSVPLGTFTPGDTVDFIALTGAPVDQFEITVVAPVGDDLAPPLQLALSGATASFEVIALPEPGLTAALALACPALSAMARRRCPLSTRTRRKGVPGK